MLSSENVTLIVQRICHPLSILALKGLRQGWSGRGFHGVFGCEGFFTAMIGTASSSALVMPGITRSIFLTLSSGAVAEELLQRSRARKDLIPFCQYTFPDYMAPAHIQSLADALEAVERGDIKRLMVLMPPRHGKSELVSALYEQGRIHHVGFFPDLEDQLCEWVPGDKSLDRLDALVWAITELMLGEEEQEVIVVFDAMKEFGLDFDLG